MTAKTLAVGFCALALLGSIACDSGFVETGGVLISNQQEVEIGAGVDQEIEAEYRIVDPADPLSLWAAQLVAPLAKASLDFRDPAEFGGYKVEVIDDPELVNAFAAPGGYTYISTGLLLAAVSCGEIAGVLGHELGHVTERHGVKALEKSVLASQLANALLGEGVGSEVAVLVWEFLQSTQFSQIQESQSDAVGVQVAFGAGYNPYGLVDFFQALLKGERRQGVEIPEFLSSHPATQARIDAITALIEQLYGAQVDPGTTQTYQCVGTDLQLAAVQDRVKTKTFTVKAGTGTRPRRP